MKVKCPRCKTSNFMDMDGENIVCHKCGNFWERDRSNDSVTNLPKCPQCDADIETIYPQTSKNVVKFTCGHVITRKNFENKNYELQRVKK